MVLQRTSSWNDLPYVAYPPGQVQLTVVEYNIPANTSLPWHTHAAPNTAFIISGAITIEERATGRVATYRAGEAFAESVDNVHRGFTGPEPARIVVAYAGAVGVPLSTPVPD
jgi:quercetin dioxygenase-like cupin family protein